MTKIKLKNSLKRALFGAMLLTSVTAGAQDIGFSQFYANPLYLNPAMAGSAVAPRVSISYRSQWPSLVSPYTTISASYDQYINDLHGGVGVILMTDRVGDHGALSTNMLGAMYSFRFQVSSDIFLSAALQASVVNTNLRWDNYLRFPDQIDRDLGFSLATNATPPDKLSKMSVDFNAGVLVSSSHWYAGVAAAHLTQPNQAFYSEDLVPMKITVHGGGLINVAEEERRQSSLGLGSPIVSPNIIYQYQGGDHYFNLGVNLDWMPVVVGVWYRHGKIRGAEKSNADALIFMAGIQQDFFKVGYSYDVTVSKLANVTGGAHELTLGILMPVPEHKKKIRAVRCPSF